MAPNKRFKYGVGRFLDLEAAQDDSDDSETYDDDDDDEGSSISAPEAHSSFTNPTASLLSFNAIERRKELELLAEESQKIVGDIQARHALLKSTGDNRSFGTVQDDTDLQNDRVPAGMEAFMNPPRDHDLWALSLEPTAHPYDVISHILSKASSESSCVISAFAPALSSKIVYIETWVGSGALEAFLAGVAPVLHLGSNRSRLCWIPPNEWSNTFDRPPQGIDNVLSPGTWVRVHKRGRYYGDLGVMTQVGGELGDDVAEVVLVPRIQQPGHHSRPPRALFDESTIKNLYPIRSIRRRDDFYEFKNNLFSTDGYLYQNIDIDHLTTQVVDPTEGEVLLFGKSVDATVKGLYDTEMKKCRLRINDRVQVHSGELRGQTGYVVAIDNLGFVSIQEELTSDIFDAPGDEVEKFFLLGDAVRILDGNHEGTCGFIVSLDGDTAELFDPKSLTYTLGQIMPPPAIYANTSSLEWDLGSAAVESTSIINNNTANILGLAAIESTSIISDETADVSGSAAAETTPIVNDKTAYFSSKVKDTKDPYLGMEVVFQRKSKLKGHRGVVTGSQFNEHPTIPDKAIAVDKAANDEVTDIEEKKPGTVVNPSGNRITVTVKMLTQAVNTIVQEKIVNLVDTKTGLPLTSARWVPRTAMPIWTQLDRQEAVSTPMHPSAQAGRLLSPAWNPHELTTAAPLPGSWLLDKRLQDKRLDITIQGTKKTLYRNGRYDGQRGFTVIKDQLRDTKAVIMVKLGMAETQVKLPIQYVFPETTTEHDPSVSPQAAQPIYNVNGTRVVIIGEDTRGYKDFIGALGAVVTGHRYEMLPMQVLVALFKQKTHVRFPIHSLCRSLEGPFTFGYEQYN